MEYKDKLDAFKSSCRVYKQEKLNLEKLLQEESDPVKAQYIRYVQEDVVFVEGKLDEIEEKCGPNARLMVWELFVENKTQASVAEEYHLTRRQLQYSVNKWMREVLQ